MVTTFGFRESGAHKLGRGLFGVYAYANGDAVFVGNEAVRTPSPAAPAAPTAPGGVRAAWDRARAAGSYRAVLDLEQTLVPRPIPENIGERSQQVDFRLDADVRLPDQALVRLRAELKDLREGLEMVEEKARGELGMVKPDEIYVRLK